MKRTPDLPTSASVRQTAEARKVGGRDGCDATLVQPERLEELHLLESRRGKNVGRRRILAGGLVCPNFGAFNETDDYVRGSIRPGPSAGLDGFIHPMDHSVAPVNTLCL